MSLKDELRDFMGGGRTTAPAPESIKQLEEHQNGTREQEYAREQEQERQLKRAEAIRDAKRAEQERQAANKR